MPNIHDIALIGAGPAAVAALAALPTNTSTVIVTGAAAAEQDARAHPKIRAVASELREAPGVARPLYFAGAHRGELYDTAAPGGLANYWGQQFVRYAKHDPWPRSLFTTYADYEVACARVESLFVCTPETLHDNTRLLTDGYEACTPKLLTGTPGAQASGLLAMRKTFRRLAISLGAKVMEQTAVRWECVGDHVRVHLADGTVLAARRLLLAAGAVGSLRLIMASCSDITAVQLSDHAPYMFYVAGLARHLDLVRSDGFFHFNCVSVERIGGGRVSLFASLYRISRAPLTLTLATLGLPPIFPKLRPPGFVDLVTPVQVWTPSSQMRYRLNRGGPSAHLIERPEPERDAELSHFRKWLSNLSTILHRSSTPPGHGFHYHAGEVSFDGATFMPLCDFLKQRFANCVLCVDASILPEIGCRPHTLTAMAAGHACVTRLLANPETLSYLNHGISK